MADFQLAQYANEHSIRVAAANYQLSNKALELIRMKLGRFKLCIGLYFGADIAQSV